MKLAILCKDCGDVDIISNVPDMKREDDIEEYLSCELGYDPCNIYWIDFTGRFNELTPEDFG